MVNDSDFIKRLALKAFRISEASNVSKNAIGKFRYWPNWENCVYRGIFGST